MANRSPTTFGTLLRRYRMAALLTQEQLAARAQLGSDTIRALERGKRRTPRPDSIHLLVDALSLTGAERETLLAAAARPETSALADNRAVTPPRVSLGAAPPGSLIGRESELETIRQRMVNDRGMDVERSRLLTLTGPAGVGKTRLALAAASEIADYFPDGVVLVDLTPVRDPVLVLTTIARALGLADTGRRPLAERLCDYLRERSMLLVLDNFEQVLPAAGALAHLLATCTGLALLVTSRIPLHLRAEWTLRIAPLPVPDLNVALPSVDTLAEIPAVALFVERARARRADFALGGAQAPLVARLTSELDGLPLAIELAAARLDGLALPTIARRLGDRLRLLHWEAPDVPARQHSLVAAIDWSYDLLSIPEQRLFRCLGVFAGPVSLPAITSVVAAVARGEAGEPEGAGWASARDEVDEGRILEGLASLTEKSLVLPTGQLGNSAPPAGPEEDVELDPVFRMLQTVREYARERLAAEGELEAAQRAHAHYFLALAERADPHLRGHDQLGWFLRLEHEHDNLRAALRWWLADDAQDGSDATAGREGALRLVSALAYFWWTRGYLVEGWRCLEEALRRAPEGEPTVRLRALLGAGAMLAYQGEFDRSRAVLDEALFLAQARQQPAEVAQALAYSGLRAVYAGDATSSVPLLREALCRARDLDDPHLAGLTLMYLGAAAFARGHDEEAASLDAQSLASFEMAGDALFAANLHVHLGWFAWRRGDLPDAVRHIRVGLEASVTFAERRLLSVSAQAALSLPGGTGEPTNLALQARLVGAVDALSQATGMTLRQTMLKASLSGLRDQLRDAELEAAYREGRSLPFDAVATLVLTLLDSVPQSSDHAQPATDPASDSGKPHDRSRRDNLLSPRQREVLALVAQGLSNEAIGRRLFLSASTVNYHLSSVFNKLGVRTRAQAVGVAAQRGLL